MAAVGIGLSVGCALFGLAWSKFLLYFGVGTLVASLARLTIEVRAERSIAPAGAPRGRPAMSAPSLSTLLVSRWTLSPSVLVPALAAAAMYGLGVRRAGGRWPLRRTASFLGGISCVVFALQSGIDAYDDRLLSIHMVQHMLLLLVAPALLLGGRPLILALRALPPRRRSSLAKAVHSARAYTAPVPALAVFGAVVVLTHLPGFYDATLAERCVPLLRARALSGGGAADVVTAARR